MRPHFVFIGSIAYSTLYQVVGFTARFHIPACHGRRRRHVRSIGVSSSSALAMLITDDSSSNPTTGNRQRILIVGGGIGGLAVASRLAGPTTNVTILEKQSSVGGRCGSWTDDQGYRHERGPSLLLLPHIYEQLFQDVTKASAKEYGLEYQQCFPSYRAIFDDGDYIDIGYPLHHANYSTTVSKMDRLEPEGSSRWHDYMRACEAFLNCGLPNFIEERLDLKTLPNFLFQSLRGFGKAWPLNPHSDVLDRIFQSAKMKALASFQDLYVGLEPYRKNKDWAGGGVLTTTAPAVFGLLSAIELHPTNTKCGVYAPMGGFHSVTQSIELLARSRGVAIQCNTSVTQVTADGVWTSTGDFHAADLVIVNADLPYAEASLLLKSNKGATTNHHQEKEIFDWEDKYRFSSGVVAFHWSINTKLDMLSTHTVFLATQEEENTAMQSWETLRSNARFAEPFNFYVHCPGKTDSSACPEGCETVMVIVPCQTLLRDKALANLPRKEALRQYHQQFDKPAIETIREAVLKRMQCVSEKLKNEIVLETIDTPATYADHYNLGAGTPFGLSHGLAQLSFFRPSQPSTGTIPNVLYCGASARPGNGVPLVLIGADLVAQKALKIFQQQSRSRKFNLSHKAATTTVQ